MKNYELLYIIPNQFTDGEAKKIQEKVDALLAKRGAVLGFQESLGKKKLAYPIDKVQHGYYVVTEFELENGMEIAAITNELRLDKQILRAQVIAKHKITEQEIARQKKLREREAEAVEERKPRRKLEDKSAAKTEKADKDANKVGIEKLDEKLDEMLTDDSAV